MSDYDTPYWSEVRDEDSPLERQRADAELRDWENEQRWDRLRRDDPCRPPREEKAA